MGCHCRLNFLLDKKNLWPDVWLENVQQYFGFQECFVLLLIEGDFGRYIRSLSKPAGDKSLAWGNQGLQTIHNLRKWKLPICICGMWRFCTLCVLNLSNIDATSVGNCWKFFHQVGIFCGIFEVLKVTVGISNVHTLINSCFKLKRVLYTRWDWSHCCLAPCKSVTNYGPLTEPKFCIVKFQLQTAISRKRKEQS